MKFSVSTKLLTEILSRGQYSQVKSIISEYVANAWDADAHRVEVTIPEDFSANPIIIADDGEGIDLKAFSEVAANRRNIKKWTQNERPVIGCKGIGRWAGFAFADRIHIESRRNGMKYRFILDKNDLEKQQMLADYECIVTEEITESPNGTTITLFSNQKKTNPSPEGIASELLLEFGAPPDFSIAVNERVLQQEDIPGHNIKIDFPSVDFGNINGSINILTTPAKKVQAGVIIRVNGRRVVGPEFFGAEQDYPNKILARIRGELTANGLSDIITSNREAFIEYDPKYVALKEWLRGKIISIAASIQEEDHSDLTTEILAIPAVRDRYNKLPSYLRQEYSQQLKLLTPKFGRFRKDKELLTLFGLLLLRAMESVDFQSILGRLQETDPRDVITLAKVLREWGFGEIARASNLIQERLEVLKKFSDLIQDNSTLELQHIHAVLEKNTWIVDERYDLFMSNRSLKAVASKLGGNISGENSRKRPDLILKKGTGNDFLLIELKRPSEIIGLTEAAQILTYRASLLREFPEQRELDLFLIGREYDEDVRISYPSGNNQRLQLLSLNELVNGAFCRLHWLEEQLKEACEEVEPDLRHPFEV